MFFKKILNKIFVDSNESFLKSAKKIVFKINELEKKFEKFSDDHLREKILYFKKELKKIPDEKKEKYLEKILPEVFAIVREASKRTLGQRHFDVQLIGGIGLFKGKVVQMLTGEGKTLTATLALTLNALVGKGVHLVTVNDYLARRDTVWMGQIYHFLGLSLSCLNSEQSFLYDPTYQKVDKEKEKLRDELGSFYIVEDYLRPISRKEAYLKDIIYGTNHEFGFDYLKDNMALSKEELVQRPFYYALIDEIDFILIDEARTPLIISQVERESSFWYKEFSQIIPLLEKEKDYEIDEKVKSVSLTEQGIEKIERILKIENIYKDKGLRYLHFLEQSLRAYVLFKKDRDYIVKDGKIIIVDEFTGRLMPKRRWSGGLHQAIEAKEGVKIQPESITLASISLQNYFRMYPKLAGMTGTAETSAEEFEKTYGLEVVVIPPHKKMIRKDFADKVFLTERAKFKAIVKEIKKRYQKGQPILIGTRSIEKSEYLSFLLKKEKIPHQVLNAKHHQKEGEIIAQAGRFKAVTVATNMAGRGVDIILGGNPPDEKEAQKVKKLGGLFVLGTERHEDRRIDNQLRGRAGRQGDPGESQFFISLEDDLIRIFGGEKIREIAEKFNFPREEPIENSLVSSAIESAQRKIEGIHFDMRRHLLEYDEVLNNHRKKFYEKRRRILEFEKKDLKNWIKKILQKNGYLAEEFFQKEKEVGEKVFLEISRFLILKIFDSFWQKHLEEMEILKDASYLKAYGGKDPLIEYKIEAHRRFKNFFILAEKTVASLLMKLKPTSSETQVKPSFEPVLISKKVGRNDLCPCGSRKKYKKCCWPKYG